MNITIIKRIWIIALIICLAFAFSACGGQTEEAPAEEQQTEAASDDQNAAYEMAKGMLEAAPFSRQGMLDFLSSESGGYSQEAAEAAVSMMEENGEVDWFAEAERAASDYKDMMMVTKEEVLEQLSSENGDQFTLEEATAAVEKVFEE